MALIDCDRALASDTFAKRDISRDLHQKEGTLKFNNDSQGSHPTGDEEATSSHTIGIKNVCDISRKILTYCKVELSSIECCRCYLTLCVVTFASVCTTPPEYVHVLLCCVFLAELGIHPNQLGARCHPLSLQ